MGAADMVLAGWVDIRWVYILVVIIGGLFSFLLGILWLR